MQLLAITWICFRCSAIFHNGICGTDFNFKQFPLSLSLECSHTAISPTGMWWAKHSCWPHFFSVLFLKMTLCVSSQSFGIHNMDAIATVSRNVIKPIFRFCLHIFFFSHSMNEVSCIRQPVLFSGRCDVQLIAWNNSPVGWTEKKTYDLNGGKCARWLKRKLLSYHFFFFLSFSISVVLAQ